MSSFPSRNMHDLFHYIGALVQTLLPIMREIKDDLTSLKESVTSLNKTMSQQHETIRRLNETINQQHETMISLSEDLEVHKSRMTSELADLQTSLQSFPNTTPTDLISRAVLLAHLPYLHNVEENFMTDFTNLID